MNKKKTCEVCLVNSPQQTTVTLNDTTFKKGHAEPDRGSQLMMLEKNHIRGTRN